MVRKWVISDLAALINANAPKKPTEATLYGTVSVFNDSIAVKIDGAPEPTPVSTDLPVQNGDRVSLLLKDHDLAVTGILTTT